MSYFNPKQAGLFADWYGRGGGGWQNLTQLCNSCLNGPIDLKFGMYIVLGKISRYRVKTLKKNTRKLMKMLISAFLSTRSKEKGPSQRNDIKSVADVIFQFCFHL